MIYTAQRIEGFVCGPWLSGARGSFLADMAAWRAEGLYVADETNFDEAQGATLDSRWVAAFDSLFSGAHLGKVVVRV